MKFNVQDRPKTGARLPRVSIVSTGVGILVIAVIAAVAVAAGGDWGTPSTMHVTTTSACNIGTITGIVGSIAAVSESTANGAKVSKGEFGAKWTNQQSTAINVPAPVPHDNRLAHVYSRDPTQGAPANHYLIVDVIQKFKTGGHAEVLNPQDPSWWFDAQATVQFVSLKVEWYDQGSSSWQDVSLPGWNHAGTTPGYMNARGDDLANNNQPPNPPTHPNPYSTPTQTTGSTQKTWNGYTSTAGVPHSQIRVAANTHCRARPGTADNAKAETVKIYMELTLQTKMSTSAPQFGPK